MAKIEMDVSEYEIMKENKKLLEDSLKRERELQASIEKLNEEKIKAYEDAQMKVVKYIKNENIQRVVCIDEIGLTRLLEYYYVTRNVFREKIKVTDFSNFFSVIDSKQSYHTNIETIGMDSIKAEIESSIRKEHEEKLESAEKIINSNNFLFNENKILLENFNQLQLKYNDLEKEKDDLEKTIESNKKLNLEKTKKLQSLLNKIYNLVEKTPLFGKSKIIYSIKILIKENE